MKTIAKLLALSLVVMIAACSKENEADPGNMGSPPGNTDMALKEAFLFAGEAYTNPEIGQATESAAFVITNDGLGNEDVFGAPFRPCFIKCLKSLHLDSARMSGIHEAFIRHHHCRADIVKKIREIHMHILAEANHKRHELIGAYNNGKITEAQLREALHKLHHSTMEALRNHPGRMELLKRLRACHHEFRAFLDKILTADEKKALADCRKGC